MDRAERKVVDDVAAFGFHMITVPDDDVGPGFTYTIGLFKTWKHPEVVIFGTGPEGPKILSHLGTLVRQGSVFAEGTVTDELLVDTRCTFKAVRPEHYGAHFGVGLWYYRRERVDVFPAVQCVWPDDRGHYPWAPACSAEVRERQPALYSDSAGH